MILPVAASAPVVDFVLHFLMNLEIGLVCYVTSRATVELFFSKESS